VRDDREVVAVKLRHKVIGLIDGKRNDVQKRSPLSLSQNVHDATSNSTAKNPGIMTAFFPSAISSRTEPEVSDADSRHVLKSNPMRGGRVASIWVQVRPGLLCWFQLYHLWFFHF
jgi:hypothetical protein